MSARSALAFSFLDRYAGLVISIVASMVIARLLTPAEIGVFSVTMVSLSFISSLRDMGAGQYLLQEKELTLDRIRATWTVQLGLGLAFSLIVLLAAYPVAAFYKEPRMLNLMLVLALNFAVSPFGSLTYAWLMREMRFDALAIMRFGGNATGACVSVGLAWKGYGAISLAIGSLAATVTNASLATFFRPREFPWMPGLKEVRRVLSIGGKVSLATGMTTVGHSIPELVLGKMQGMTSVGLYSRANGLGVMFHRLILDATQSVAMSLFSKASRDGQSLTPIFIKATSYVTVIGWSFFGVMIVLAHSIVRVLFGPQWDDSVPLTRLVAAAMAISLPAAFCATTILASGAMNTLIRITMITMVQYAILLAVGATLGLEKLGWAIVLEAILSVGIWLSMSPVMRQLSKLTFFKMLIQSGSVAATAVLASFMAVFWIPDQTVPQIVHLAIGATAAVFAFLGAVIGFKHPLRDEINRLYKAIHKKYVDAPLNNTVA